MSGGIKLIIGDTGDLKVDSVDLHELEGSIAASVKIGSSYNCIELLHSGVEVNLFFTSTSSLIQWARDLYQKAQKHAPMSQVGPVSDLKHVNGGQS